MVWFVAIGAVFVLGGFSRIFSDIGNGIVMILIGSALLIWGLRKKLFPKLFGPKANQQGSLIAETFSLAGVSYYSANIDKLACSNPAWKYTAATAISKGLANKPIYRYNYINKPVKLVPEPNNPHDKNAVAVYFAGELVGYLKADDNQHALDILGSRDIKYISGFIGGGDYKVVTNEGQIIKESEHHSVRVKIAYV